MKKNPQLHKRTNKYKLTKKLVKSAFWVDFVGGENKVWHLSKELPFVFHELFEHAKTKNNG